ncbi:MAG TPA: hypothetical protein VEY14_04545 [Nocardioidaceae bacterium]|jgi:hypothetical protein|nr:hypothetical protein [Nocardioidaceae bacterium]
MGMLSKALKAGVVAKVVEQARKPENQAKIKEMVIKARAQAQARKSR